MDYRIITNEPGTTRETIIQSGNTPWCHGSATTWAHIEGRKLPAGTRIMIDRRRGLAMYMSHRRYIVDPGGIVRRTDRTP